MDTFQRNKQQKLLDDCTNSLQTSVELVNEYCTDEQKETYIKQIKKIAKSYCESDVKNEKCDAALKLTTEHINGLNGDKIENVDTVFKEKLEECVIGSVSLEEHKVMQRIKKALLDSKTANDADANNSLVASQSFHVPVDPITKSYIQVPWRSKVCHHVFEHQTVLEYVKMRKGKPAKCPYIGCTNVNLQLEDMYLDKELLKQIQLNPHDESSIIDTDIE